MKVNFSKFYMAKGRLRQSKKQGNPSSENAHFTAASVNNVA
jgi:hypothetical protein